MISEVKRVLYTHTSRTQCSVFSVKQIFAVGIMQIHHMIIWKIKFNQSQRVASSWLLYIPVLLGIFGVPIFRTDFFSFIIIDNHIVSRKISSVLLSIWRQIFFKNRRRNCPRRVDNQLAELRRQYRRSTFGFTDNNGALVCSFSAINQI